MFCVNCGVRLGDAANFCAGCGSPVKRVGSGAAVSEVPEVSPAVPQVQERTGGSVADEGVRP
jgi:hypothetical protein